MTDFVVDATNHHELSLFAMIQCMKQLRFHMGRVTILIRNQAAVSTILDTRHGVNRHYARQAKDLLFEWFSENIENELTIGWLPKEYQSLNLGRLEVTIKVIKRPRPEPMKVSAASLVHEAKKDFHNEWNDEIHLKSYMGRSFIRMGKGGQHIKMRQANADIYIRECADGKRLLARFTRAMTNHAPIGTYYKCFKHLNRHLECKSFEGDLPGTAILSRSHILDEYHKYTRFWEGWLTQARWSQYFLRDFVDFLVMNPFAFARAVHRTVTVTAVILGVANSFGADRIRTEFQFI
jgi:hypothetical protein